MSLDIENVIRGNRVVVPERVGECVRQICCVLVADIENRQARRPFVDGRARNSEVVTCSQDPIDVVRIGDELTLSIEVIDFRSAAVPPGAQTETPIIATRRAVVFESFHFLLKLAGIACHRDHSPSLCLIG